MSDLWSDAMTVAAVSCSAAAEADCPQQHWHWAAFPTSSGQSRHFSFLILLSLFLFSSHFFFWADISHAQSFSNQSLRVSLKTDTLGILPLDFLSWRYFDTKHKALWALSSFLSFIIIKRGHFINFSAFCSVRNDDLWDWFTSAACIEAKIGSAQQCTLPRGPLGEEDILGYPSQQYARKATKIVNCKMNTSLLIMMREWFILCEDQIFGNSACLWVHFFHLLSYICPRANFVFFANIKNGHASMQVFTTTHSGDVFEDAQERIFLWRCTGERCRCTGERWRCRGQRDGNLKFSTLWLWFQIW